jgi:hypothetical protein
MAIQLGLTLRSNRLDQVESTTGTSAKLRIHVGTQPATCATADSGTLLVEMSLPSDWMNAASGGTKTLLGTWSGTASGTGTAGHFRIKDSGGTVCHLQGSVTATSGGGDIELDNTSINSGQTVSITTFTLTDGNV